MRGGSGCADEAAEKHDGVGMGQVGRGNRRIGRLPASASRFAVTGIAGSQSRTMASSSASREMRRKRAKSEAEDDEQDRQAERIEDDRHQLRQEEGHAVLSSGRNSWI